MADFENDPFGMNAVSSSEHPAFQSVPIEAYAGETVVPFRREKPREENPTIQIKAGELHNIATEAEDALIAARVPFYVRGGLVQPVLDEVEAAHGRRVKVVRLKSVASDAVVDYLSRCANWQKWDGRAKKQVAADPSLTIAKIILSREAEWRFRVLAGVITCPTLRPDGTILSKAGYDRATQLLLISPPEIPDIPAKPTKADATNALELLCGLLQEFPFVDGASKSVALSAMITPVARGAMDAVPMHATSAPTPGSGKSYIFDIASTIPTGERAPVITAGKTEEELEKRLGAALLSGQPIVSIDNVNGELGGDQLCQMIERPVVQVRKLGTSDLVKIASRATTFATGNNIRLVADMTRRAVVCSLDPNMERPELRQFRFDPLEAILADRGTYIAAALTICRAYVVAGCPGELPPLASFEQWSRFVRSALVWLGCEDPCDTMERARAEDPVASTLGALLSSWHAAMGPAPVKTSEVVNAGLKFMQDAHSGRLHPDLFEALTEVATDKRGNVTGKALGFFLRSYAGRIVDGFKLMKAGEDTHSKQVLWKVIKP